MTFKAQTLQGLRHLFDMKLVQQFPCFEEIDLF